MRGKFYKVKAKALKNQTANAKYGHKVFKKGKIYEVRRKLPKMVADKIKAKRYSLPNWKFISIKEY